MTSKAAHTLLPRESARIVRFEDMVLAGKLMSMGVLPHATIELVRRNALGYTLIFKVNNRFKMALRRDEAKTIIVEGL